MSVFSDFWANLKIPDDFKNDAYAYVGNQAGHVLIIGFSLTAILIWVIDFVFGAFPRQWTVALGVLLFYVIVWEYYIQGWRPRDSFEDSKYVFKGTLLYYLLDFEPISELSEKINLGVNLRIIDVICLVIISFSFSLASGIYRIEMAKKRNARHE